MSEKKEPVFKTRAGQVQASVFENKTKSKDGKEEMTFLNTTITRSYKDGDTWKDTNENPTGLLDKDFAEVPIIQGLNETAKFMLPIFYPHGAIKNIHFINQRVTI